GQDTEPGGDAHTERARRGQFQPVPPRDWLEREHECLQDEAIAKPAPLVETALNPQTLVQTPLSSRTGLFRPSPSRARSESASAVSGQCALPLTPLRCVRGSDVTTNPVRLLSAPAAPTTVPCRPRCRKAPSCHPARTSHRSRDPCAPRSAAAA